MSTDSAPPIKGGPPAKGKGKGSSGEGLKKMAGPLPIWGWGVVVIGSVFLYRRIIGGKSATTAAPGSPSATPGYPTNSGPVVVLPSGIYGSGGGSGSAASNGSTTTVGQYGTPTTVPTDTAVQALVGLENAGGRLPPMTSQQSTDLANMAQQFNGLPSGQQPAVQNFFQRNVANQKLGLPYVIPGSNGGPAQVYNPATGTSVPVSS